MHIVKNMYRKLDFLYISTPNIQAKVARILLRFLEQAAQGIHAACRKVT